MILKDGIPWFDLNDDCLLWDMVGWPIRLQRYELYMFGIPDIYHCGSMLFPGITIVA